MTIARRLRRARHTRRNGMRAMPPCLTVWSRRRAALPAPGTRKKGAKTRQARRDFNAHNLCVTSGLAIQPATSPARPSWHALKPLHLQSGKARPPRQKVPWTLYPVLWTLYRSTSRFTRPNRSQRRVNRITRGIEKRSDVASHTSAPLSFRHSAADQSPGRSEVGVGSREPPEPEQSCRWVSAPAARMGDGGGSHADPGCVCVCMCVI